MLACNIADSFAKYRWCPNIIGPQSGGAVKDLPVHLFETMGQIQAKIPTEVLVTDRREFELAEEGFITLTMRKDSDNAAFFSANSVQKPKHFPGKDAETNYKLGTQLPYLFIINRLAHYIKVLQREQLGSWKERSDLEESLIPDPSVCCRPGKPAQTCAAANLCALPKLRLWMKANPAGTRLR